MTNVRFGPARWVDDDLLTIDVDGVQIDRTAGESIQLRAHETGCWTPWPTSFADTEIRCLNELRLRVQPLASLLAYKQVIGRATDVADLQRVDRS